MNRVIKAQLELETRRQALGILLDIPTEDRAEDYAGSWKRRRQRSPLPNRPADRCPGGARNPGAQAGQPAALS